MNINCSYFFQFNEIKKLWIINKLNINSIKFYEDKRPEVGLIESIDYVEGSLIEIEIDSENTSLSQKLNDNSFDISLDTTINLIDYITSTELQSYLCDKFLVIFRTGEKMYFVFGVDEGAKLTYDLNLDSNNAYKVSLSENNSIYPIFQSSPSIIQ
ncbi:hypothetical protein EZS27_004648 [termite gut metagenome]|uniref:Uncharacterized protein n=1 Tax=termite gut metagenome TaxID=433724 RepID=A0A5J4SPI3_9ZZZZ